jgi:Cof subfamily protein (haloacid dehalogenase superfamily)
LKYKLIAIDLDGTLLNKEGAFIPGRKEAIRLAIKQRMKVVLATGRMYQPTVRYAQKLGLTTPVICYQGAMIRELYYNNILWHKSLSIPISRIVIEHIRQIGLHLYAYVDDKLYVEEIAERAQWYAQFNGVQLNLISDLSAFLRKRPTEIVAWGERMNIDRLVSQLSADSSLNLLVTKSYPHFCEIGNPASGKGNALKYLAKLLGVEQSQTIAIGDGPNDISMLKWAGLGLAISTAPSEVTDVADFIVDAENRDGLVQLMERLLNI